MLLSATVPTTTIRKRKSVYNQALYYFVPRLNLCTQVCWLWYGPLGSVCLRRVPKWSILQTPQCSQGRIVMNVSQLLSLATMLRQRNNLSHGLFFSKYQHCIRPNYCTITRQSASIKCFYAKGINRPLLVNTQTRVTSVLLSLVVLRMLHEFPTLWSLG